MAGTPVNRLIISRSTPTPMMISGQENQACNPGTHWTALIHLASLWGQTSL
jgi:hypothetical protein